MRLFQQTWQIHLDPISMPPSGGFAVSHLVHNLNLCAEWAAPISNDGIILGPLI